MKVLVAGASGVVGRALLPALAARGHEVWGLVRSKAGALHVRVSGAQPIVADALDGTAVAAAFERVRPEAVIHQLTALPADGDIWRFERTFAQTNRLRTTGTDNLIAAALAVGARRMVAQSFCGWPYERVGGPVKTEGDAFDPAPPRALRTTLGSLVHLEAAVLSAPRLEGVVLRYGGFYGPGTALSIDGPLVQEVRRRRIPLVADGGGIWSFVHISDVVSATVLALEGEQQGTFNVVDDEPAPVREWLPALADAVGAPPPRRLPRLVAKLLLPEHVFLMMTDVRGGSNRAFKETFGWAPVFPSWRLGFRRGLASFGGARQDGALPVDAPPPRRSNGPS
jgi:2-alkyl-3-oxoalkanoate reductase